MRVRQPELLALVEERGAAQGEHEHRGDSGALEPVARGGTRMVVVVETPGRPAGFARQVLELVDRRTEAARRPGQVQEEEVVGQVELVAGDHVAGERALVQDVNLADRDAVAVELLEHPADRGEARMHRGPILVVAVARLVVAQRRVLADLVGDVDPEAVDAAPQPEAQHFVHRLRDRRLVPVEVRLLRQERVEVPLRRALVARPGGALLAERRGPVVRQAVPRAPHVPRPARAVGITPRLLEPRVAVRGVVGHEVEQDAEAQLVRPRDQRVGVGERAEARVNRRMVGDVVTEVGHRRAVDGRQPDGVGPQIADMLEPARDTAQVADPVARRRRRRSAGACRRTRSSCSAGRPGRHTYHDRRALRASLLDSSNHGWRSEVWLGTKSNSTRRPSSCARAISASASASVPKLGSTAVWSEMS